MKRIKRLAFSLIATLSLAVPVMAPVAVSAQDINNNLKCGANLNFSAASGTDCEQSATGGDAASRVDGIIKNVVNIISLAVAVVAVIMIIISGLRYITSGGDSGKVSGAKDTIIYAIVGLIVVALAQVIVRFVVGKATTTTS